MTLAPADFQFVCELVLRRSAIVIEPTKEYLVEARLSPVAKSEGLATVADLVKLLRASATGSLVDRVVEAMTTNETSFFRDVHPFETLKNKILPALLASRASERRLSIWSAASSTGQEAYSIAMCVLESYPLFASWDVSIVGTDLSSNVVEVARAGVFRQNDANRGLSPSLLTKYFEQVPAGWRVRQELRRMVEFRSMNLIEPWPALPRFDIVFLRNVLIYFGVDTKREILRKVRGTMALDGYLFLGGAETPRNIDATLEASPEIGCYRIKAGTSTRDGRSI